MKVESIAECSPWSILQYFWPVISDNLSWKPICGLFESGRFTKVLLYNKYLENMVRHSSRNNTLGNNEIPAPCSYLHYSVGRYTLSVNML